MISDGRWTASITPAIVIVLPVPVAPRSVLHDSPASMLSAMRWMAFGWSAVGEYTESSLNAGIADQQYGGHRTEAPRSAPRPASHTSCCMCPDGGNGPPHATAAARRAGVGYRAVTVRACPPP